MRSKAQALSILAHKYFVIFLHTMMIDEFYSRFLSNKNKNCFNTE